VVGNLGADGLASRVRAGQTVVDIGDQFGPKRGRPMPRMRVLIRPAVWIVYVVIVFEILFMISPFALHFYAAYGPMLFTTLTAACCYSPTR
jgi:hypothetical protein